MLAFLFGSGSPPTASGESGPSGEPQAKKPCTRKLAMRLLSINKQKDGLCCAGRKKWEQLRGCRHRLSTRAALLRRLTPSCTMSSRFDFSCGSRHALLSLAFFLHLVSWTCSALPRMKLIWCLTGGGVVRAPAENEVLAQGRFLLFGRVGSLGPRQDCWRCGGIASGREGGLSY